jgi:hypothetical protein
MSGAGVRSRAARRPTGRRFRGAPGRPRLARMRRAMALLPRTSALGIDVGWRTAARDAAWAVLASKAIVWVSGIVAWLWWKRAPNTQRLDLFNVTEPFGGVGDVLIAPFARWDTVWFLSIADHGYGARGGDEAFFPLYPTLMGLLGWSNGSLIVVGILISTVAMLAGLTVLHRLVALDFPKRIARLTVVLVALFPTAVFLSAVYSEALFLALSVGAIYAARTGRWAWAGVLGGFAAATRSAGLFIIVPLAILYLWGPRSDRPGLRPIMGGAIGAVPSDEPLSGRLRVWLQRLMVRLRPRYELRWDAAWLLLAPAGLLGYMGFLWISGTDPMAPFASQGIWHRSFQGPLGGFIDGFSAAVDGARQLLSGSREPVYFTKATGDPFVVGTRNLVLFGFLIFAIIATVGALRRLPFAYGAYAVAALSLPLSFPVTPQPLMSLQRFLVVLFPLQLWLAVALADRPKTRAVMLALFIGGLIAVTAIFATWRWFS